MAGFAPLSNPMQSVQEGRKGSIPSYSLSTSLHVRSHPSFEIVCGSDVHVLLDPLLLSQGGSLLPRDVVSLSGLLGAGPPSRSRRLSFRCLPILSGLGVHLPLGLKRRVFFLTDASRYIYVKI